MFCNSVVFSVLFLVCCIVVFLSLFVLIVAVVDYFCCFVVFSYLVVVLRLFFVC